MKFIFATIALMVLNLNSYAQDILKENFPVFTNTIYLKCTDYVPGYCDVIHAPFEVVLGETQFISDAALSDIDVFSGIVTGVSSSKIDMIYETFIKKMRKNPQDSSYFAGEITFNFTINGNGIVEQIYIENSTTNNKAFDEEVKKNFSKWAFKKSNGKTKFKLPIQFKRTKYSGKKIEREKQEIKGDASPLHSENL